MHIHSNTIDIHSNIIVQLQNGAIVFLMTYILFGGVLYPTHTAIATGSNCRGELEGCSSTLVSPQLQKQTVSWDFDTFLGISMDRSQ